MPKPGWKGPGERWDRHSRPRARAALDSAREAGWWLKKSSVLPCYNEGAHVLKKSSGSAKVWGVITCGDPSLPPSERCSASVMSTSGPPDGSETAQVIQDLLRTCTHDRATRMILLRFRQSLKGSGWRLLALA